MDNYGNVKKWRERNPDKLRKQKQRYRIRNKDKINSYWREWYKKRKGYKKPENEEKKEEQTND